MLNRFDRIRIQAATEEGGKRPRPAQLRHTRVFGIRAFRGSAQRRIDQEFKQGAPQPAAKP
jgi:hypothetical protein